MKIKFKYVQDPFGVNRAAVCEELNKILGARKKFIVRHANGYERLYENVDEFVIEKQTTGSVFYSCPGREQLKNDAVVIFYLSTFNFKDKTHERLFDFISLNWIEIEGEKARFSINEIHITSAGGFDSETIQPETYSIEPL